MRASSESAFRRRLPTVDYWEREVHEDQIRPKLGSLREALGPIGGERNVVLVLQDLPEQVSVEFDVLDYQHGLHGSRCRLFNALERPLKSRARALPGRGRASR